MQDYNRKTDDLGVPVGGPRGACLVRPVSGVRAGVRQHTLREKRFFLDTNPDSLRPFFYKKNGTGAIPSQTRVFVSRKTSAPLVSLQTKNVRKPKRTRK